MSVSYLGCTFLFWKQDINAYLKEIGGMKWSRHAISVRVLSRKQKPLWPEGLKTGNYVLTKASGLEESLPGHMELAPQWRSQNMGSQEPPPPEPSRSSTPPAARLQANPWLFFTWIRPHKGGRPRLRMASHNGSAWAGCQWGCTELWVSPTVAGLQVGTKWDKGPQATLDSDKVWLQAGEQGVPLTSTQNPRRTRGTQLKYGTLRGAAFQTQGNSPVHKGQCPYRGICSSSRDMAPLSVALWAAGITRAHDTKDQRRGWTPLGHPQGQG